MERLGFLYVLNGVIAGMALAGLINGYASIIQYYSKLDIYWVHLVLSLFVFVLIVEYWFFIFDWDEPTTSFWLYLISLFYPMTLFFISSTLFPSIDYIQEHCCKPFPFFCYYYDFAKWYYGLAVIGVLIAYCHNVLYNEKKFISKTQIIRLISGVLVLCLAISKAAWFHEISMVIAVAILFAFLYSRYKTGSKTGSALTY